MRRLRRRRAVSTETGPLPRADYRASGPLRPSAAPDTSLSRWQRWTVLAIVSSGLLLVALDMTILYTALPRLTSALEASASQQLWILNIYPLFMAGLLPGSGALGDRFGHKRTFQAGMLVFGVASLTAAYSPTPEVLIGARALLAVGGALMLPATLALIRISFFNVRERNIAIAVWASTFMVAMAMGPIVAGVLLEFFWWGAVFLINLPIVVAASIAMVLVGPRNVYDAARKWDAVSSAQALVGMGAAVLAIKTWAESPIDYPVAIVSTAVGAVVLTLFARRQVRLGRESEPLIDFGMFRNRGFTGGVIGAGLATFITAGVQLAVAQRYQLLEGFSPLQAGLLVTALAVGSAPFSLVGGALLQRVGLLVLIGGGMGVAALGTVAAALSAFQDTLPGLVASLVVAGAGMGCSISVASTAIMGNVPPHRAGMAASTEEVSYEFGNLLGVALLGALLTLVYTHTLILPEGAEGYTGASPAAALESGDAGVIDAASSAFDAAYLSVLVTLAAVMIAGSIAAAAFLWPYKPGTESQAYPNNH
ncbi:MFS transporter [Nesterenkonia populi]